MKKHTFKIATLETRQLRGLKVGDRLTVVAVKKEKVGRDGWITPPAVTLKRGEK